MLTIRQKIIRPGQPLKKARNKRVVLRVADPFKRYFIFTARYSRAGKISDWDSFFEAVRSEFKKGIGGYQRKNSIERFQLKIADDIMMWLRHLVAGKDFSRGDARAIEEILINITEYSVAGEEKYRDRYRFWSKRERFTTRWRWEVTEYLRERFPGLPFDPMALYRIDKEYKKVAAAFIRKECRNPLKKDTLVKEILSRKPSVTQERFESSYRVSSKKTPYSS